MRDTTPEYTAWVAMKQRCYNKNHPKYADYGGRGIRVCDKWLRSYDEFLSHVGKRPSDRHSIDRIDNDGNYQPGNVRWATRAEQANNTRGNIRKRGDVTALHQLHVRLSPGQWRKLQELARSFGMTPSAYVREMVIDKAK